MSHIGRENSASACKFQKQRMSAGGGSELLRDWSKNKKKVEVWVEKGVWRKGGGCHTVGREKRVGVPLWLKKGVWVSYCGWRKGGGCPSVGGEKGCLGTRYGKWIGDVANGNIGGNILENG